MDSGLLLTDTKLVSFPDATWRFFYQQTYRWDIQGVASAHEVLPWLIHHEAYSFASASPSGPVGSPDWISGLPRHGPYNLDCVTEAAYVVLDRSAALAAVRGWLDDSSRSFVNRPVPVPTPPLALQELQRLEGRLADTTDIFRLEDLPEECYARTRYIGPWCELVVVHTQDRNLTVFVASSD